VSAPVFISYSSKDQNVAETIYQALEARGQQCWIASRDVRPGENYQEAIVRALRSAKVMLLIFTSNANNSDEIKKELVLAGRHRVIVVPVRVEDVVPNDAFTYELATRQWVDLFKDWERQIELLAARIGHLVSGVEPAAAELPPVRAIKKSSPGHALMWGPLAALVLVAIGAAAFYMRPAKVAAPPQQTAAQTAPLAPGAPAAPVPLTPPSQPVPATPTVTAPPAAPPLQPTPALSPDEAAWQIAAAAATREAFAEYLKAFPAGAHAQEAELRIDDLILAGTGVKSNGFDGTWLTTWTCPGVGPTLGYAAQFTAQVKDGDFHSQKGAPGERGSLILNGKIEPDGTAAFFGKGVVGSSAFAVGGLQAGTPYFFHASAHFDRKSGTGHRIEGRPCNLTFAKQ